MKTGICDINVSIVALAIWLVLAISAGSAATLTSVKVDVAPVIDGMPEAVWDEATATTINVAGGANTGSHTVTLKSIYTDDSVYFLATWNDPTQSLRREPWIKQPNGTWVQLKDPDDKGGDNNKYYEDKFAQIWNINTPSFENSGCLALCHAGEAGKPYGNKYTPNPGETADLWHMKIVRTNPTGYIDDQYVDSTRYNMTSAPDAGRKSDPGLVPYYNNGINASTRMPNFTSADQPAQVSKIYWIFDDQKLPFNDTYKASDEIAGIIVRPPAGDRADIKGKAVYQDGKWTMEYGRKLTTGSQYDVQFSDLKKEYAFGIAVFDNAQVRHSYESGASKLVFGAAATPAATTPAPTATKAPAFEIVSAILALVVSELVRRR
ncbi:MAG: ethylbenzene dehydrogenase-related protein [Candidatus Methanoperedens sp.]|nr:ethylbenzene dehydrogenase-related protein [Candidatus Methanoperedens sp.]